MIGDTKRTSASVLDVLISLQKLLFHHMSSICVSKSNEQQALNGVVVRSFIGSKNTAAHRTAALSCVDGSLFGHSREAQQSAYSLHARAGTGRSLRLARTAGMRMLKRNYADPAKVASARRSNCFAQVNAENLNVHRVLLSPPMPAKVSAGGWEGSSPISSSTLLTKQYNSLTMLR